MITSTKNYTKKNKKQNKPNKRTDRTLGQMVKANLHRKKSQKEAYKSTVTKREKGKKNVSIHEKKKKKEESNLINK